MSSKHPIDALFEKELKEHKIEPSQAAWEKVAAATQTGGSTKKGYFILRAASVALLVGISSLLYFNRNTTDLQVGNTEALEESIAAGPDNTPTAKADEPKAEPTSPKTVEPKAAPKQKPTKEKPSAKKRSARVIPVLQQTISDPVLAMNDLEAVDYELALNDVETIEDPNVLHIRVQMPELKGDYSKPKNKKGDLGERMWAYASDQYQRVRSGESLELPNTDDARIEIPLPDFINRRFNK